MSDSAPKAGDVGRSAAFNTPLPRYRLLVICIRLALFGSANPTVQHMVKRNQKLDEYAALERMAQQQGLA